MKNWSVLLSFFLLTSVVNAERKPLDLELDTSSFYKEAPQEPSWAQDENYQSPEQQLSSHCQEIGKEIEALQGKPQRKFALQQRYEAECSH